MKYTIITPKTSVEFENYRQLVNYLIGNKQRNFYWPPREANLLDRVKICEGDKRHAVVDRIPSRFYSRDHVLVPIYGYVDRDVQILDEYDNNAFNDQLKKDVNTFTYSEEINREHWNYVNKGKKKYSRWNPPEVEFRKEPVPYSGSRHHYSWIRRPHTFQEKKWTTAPEYQEFHRRRRCRNLPTSWDDLCRSSNLDNSWKSSTKNRHQWENKVKIHSKKLYVYKEHPEDVEEEFPEE